MLGNHRPRRAAKRRIADEHEPERRTERIQVRATVERFLLRALFRARIKWRAEKHPATEADARRAAFVLAEFQRFDEAEVDHFDEQVVVALVLARDHQV